MVIPSVEIEQLLRNAPVKNPNLLGTLRLVERCLDTTNYLDGALDLLISENWLKTEDDDRTDRYHDAGLPRRQVSNARLVGQARCDALFYTPCAVCRALAPALSHTKHTHVTVI